MKSDESPLVIFDIDGTLLTIHKRKHTIPTFTHALKTVFGVNTEVTEKECNGMCDNNIITYNLKKEGFSEDEIFPKLEECRKAVIDYYERHFKKTQHPLLPGVRNLLEELRKRDAFIAVGTGNIRDIAMFKLEELGIKSYFDFGGFGSECFERDCLLRTAIKKAEEGGFSGSKIIAFGDTPRDIKAAKGVGIISVAVASGLDSAEELKEYNPDYVLEDLSDTKKILGIIYS